MITRKGRRGAALFPICNETPNTMKIQTLRKTPVGSVVDVKFANHQTPRRGILLTPVHTANAGTSISIYRPGVGRRSARLNQIVGVVSEPEGV